MAVIKEAGLHYLTEGTIIITNGRLLALLNAVEDVLSWNYDALISDEYPDGEAFCEALDNLEFLYNRR